MQLSIKDIKAYGGNKIALGLIINDFLNELSNFISSKHISVYSIPKLYLEGNFTVSRSVKRVLRYCEPMIDKGVSNTEALQRKFRNTWVGLWNNFISDNNLDADTYYLFTQACISPLPLELEHKLDIIVFWYLLANSETSLKDRGTDIPTMLHTLVTLDNYNFTYRYLPSLIKEVDTNLLGGDV